MTTQENVKKYMCEHCSPMMATVNKDEATRHVRDGIMDYWHLTYEPLSETVYEDDCIKHVRQSAIEVIAGESSGHRIETLKKNYFSRYEPINEDHTDICMWCGHANYVRDNAGVWTNYRMGWDCHHCGGN